MQYPITTGNVVLIIVGALLVLLGPYVGYKTATGMIRRRREDPKASLQIFSNAINFLIAVLLFMAGILFIVNNLKGNPLADFAS